MIKTYAFVSELESELDESGLGICIGDFFWCLIMCHLC